MEIQKGPFCNDQHKESSIEENGEVSSSRVSSSHRNIEKQAETVRTNFVRTLKNSQRFMATKQMLNQEKSNLKTVGKFWGILTICPCRTPFMAQ